MRQAGQAPGTARALIWRFLPSRSRQWITSPATLVTYTGTSSVRMMPESPLGRQYLMWFSVVYTSTFDSFHAADCTHNRAVGRACTDPTEPSGQSADA